MATSGLDKLSCFETIIQNIAKENNLKQSLMRQKKLQVGELKREVAEKEERIRKTELAMKTQVEMNIQMKSIVAMRQGNIYRLERHYKLLEEHEASLRRQLTVKKRESKRRVDNLQSLINRNRALYGKNKVEYQNNPLLLWLQKLEQSTNNANVRSASGEADHAKSSASGEADHAKSSAKQCVVRFDMHEQLGCPVDERTDVKSVESEGAINFEQPDTLSHTDVSSHVSSAEQVLNTSTDEDLKELTDATQQLTTKSCVAMEIAESCVTLETTESSVVIETAADVTALDDTCSVVRHQAAMSPLMLNESQIAQSKHQPEEIISTLQPKNLVNQNNQKNGEAVTRMEEVVVWKKPIHNTRKSWETTPDLRKRAGDESTVIRENPLMASTPFTIEYSNKLKTAVEERNGKSSAQPHSSKQRVSHLQTKPHSITSNRRTVREKPDAVGEMNFFTDEEAYYAKQSNADDDFTQFLQNVQYSPAGLRKDDHFDFFNDSYTYNADDVGNASYQGNFFDDSEPGPSRRDQESEQFDFFNNSPQDDATLLF